MSNGAVAWEWGCISIPNLPEYQIDFLHVCYSVLGFGITLVEQFYPFRCFNRLEMIRVPLTNRLIGGNAAFDSFLRFGGIPDGLYAEDFQYTTVQDRHVRIDHRQQF